jgi:hypothetical protein
MPRPEMSPRLRLLPLLAVAAAVCAAPAPASAAFGVVNVSAKPVDTSAGAHSNFSLHAEFTQPSDDVKDLIVHLPPGLLGDPNATPRCTRAQFNSDSCPPSTQLGTASTAAIALGMSQDSPGIVYNLVPSGSEPARLGMTFTPLGGISGKLRTEGVASVRPSDSGLDTTISNLPRTFGGVSLDITGVDVTLFGRAGTPAKPFMTNPTSCLPAKTVVEATSYANPSTSVTGESSFTPTNCSALPFAPQFSATIAGVGVTGHPVFKTVITQADGEANTRRTVVTLPKSVGPATEALANTCTLVKFKADACTANSIVGTVLAQTPIFSQPLTGTVRLVQPAKPGFPDLILDLTGPISLRLQAQSALTNGAVQTIFPAIADVPISYLQLSLKGGKNGLLSAGADLCSVFLPIKADFTAHSGARKAYTVNAVQTGCRLKGTASLPNASRGKPSLTVKVVAGAKALRSVALTLPSSLSAPAGKRLRLVGRKGGARAIALHIAPGTLALRKPVARGSKLSIKAAVKDVAGKVTTLTLRARAG